MKRWRRWLLVGVSVLIILPLLLVVGLYALLGSQSGSAWVMQQVVDRLRQQNIVLQYQSMQGNLLESLRFTRLAIDMPAEPAPQKIAMQRLLLQWQPAALFERRLHVTAIEIDGLLLQLPSDSDAAGGAPVVPEVILPVDIRLDRLQLGELRMDRADADPLLTRLALSAGFSRGQLTVSGLEIDSPYGELQGELQAGLDAAQQLSGRLQSRAPLPDIGSLEASLELAGQLLRPDVHLTVSQPLQAEAKAGINLQTGIPALNADIRWQPVGWPLTGEPRLQVSEGRLKLDGTPADYRLRLTTSVSGPDVPLSAIDLQGSGSQSGLNLSPLKVSTLEGLVQVEGEVSWQEAVRWNLLASLSQINPAVVAADWQGQLGGELAVRGQLLQAGPAGQLDIRRLDGQLRGYPLSVSGLLDFAETVFRTENLQVQVGDNQVQVKGGVADNLDLALDVNAPALEQLYPGLAGFLSGTLQVSGKPVAPAIVADLSGAELAFEQHRVAQFVLKGRLNESMSDLMLKADGLVLADNPLDSVQAGITGNLKGHTLELTLQSPLMASSVRLDGRLDKDWQATLQQLDLKNEWLDWQLQKPARLLVSTERYQLTGACLAGQGDALCADVLWLAEQNAVDARVLLEHFDFARLKPLLPQNMDIEGTVAGRLEANGPLDKLVANLELQPENGVFHFRGLEQPLDLEYRDVTVKAAFADDAGHARLAFLLGDNGQVNAEVKVGRGPARELKGTLKAGFPDLALVRGFTPDLQDLQGRLQADFVLGGKLDDPRYNGELRIVDAQANVPAAGIELRAVNVALQADGRKHLKLDASANSGDGYLNMQGRVDASTLPAGIELTVKGERFQVARLPEALVAISPDLHMQGRETLSLTGKVQVPQAKIELFELPPSVVSVSEDERIVGEVEPEKPARNIKADVKLELGDEVSFSGFGLRTGLNGFLDAVYDGKASQLFGRINLVDAEYAAYGQKLEVEKGRLLFAGPTDNAGIDLRAKRLSLDKEVTAYLDVTGRLSRPRIKVSSQPALPEAEALAYLVTGRGMDSANKEAGSEISSAAIALGLSKTLPALNEMEQRLGLDELTIDSGDGDYESSTLTVGKYINPDLYIGYVHGLFDAQGALKLNYRFTEWLELESLSGENNSADFYYKYEHD